MRTIYLILIIALFTCKASFSQTVAGKLDRAIKMLVTDDQFKHSLVSMFVVDTKTGKVIYDKNSQLGLAPASCQKIVTSASAFEILGADFRYETNLGYGYTGADSSVINVYLEGNGDPTFGSWRWKATSADVIIGKMMDEFKKWKPGTIKKFIIDDRKWGTQTIPGGWPWEDIGQYYGAGCNAFTWHENQYNIVLKPGRNIGDSVKILSVDRPHILPLINELTTGPRGSGDQVYAYCAAYSENIFLRGTAPLGLDSLTVVVSAQDGKTLFRDKIRSSLNETVAFTDLNDTGDSFKKFNWKFISPTFDSMNYWFLKNSINLYGEAFVKTIAYQKTKSGTTDSGVHVIETFWNNKGIEKSALKIIDGSGLSPANRLTTNTLVTILQYATQRPWFTFFYNALPEMNGIKMKDGYIGGVRSYTGYVQSATGASYSFAFIVNNFDGNPGTARIKMWKILDLLK